VAAKLKNCSTCNAEIASTAKTCPSCGAKNKKPIYKRWWFIFGSILIVLIAIGSMGEDNVQPPTAQNVTVEQPAVVPATGGGVTEQKPQPKPADTATMGQKNALKKAQEYLRFTAFSYKGLVEQLQYEGFSKEDAVWAVDRCGADWKEQAALQAKNYLKFSSFSRQGLIDQLIYEGYSAEQAAYGVKAVGY